MNCKQAPAPQNLNDCLRASIFRLPLVPCSSSFQEMARGKDFRLPLGLTSQQQMVRSSLMGWWIKTSEECLELKHRTIEIAIKIFDIYCWKKYGVALKEAQKPSSEFARHILDIPYEYKLTMTTCFFTASKYEEIYPPCLNDFVYYNEQFLTRKAVLEKEVDILQNVDYNIALLSDFYEVYFSE